MAVYSKKLIMQTRMSRKRKNYLRNNNSAITNYALRKMKHHIKKEKNPSNESIMFTESSEMNIVSDVNITNINFEMNSSCSNGHGTVNNSNVEMSISSNESDCSTSEINDEYSSDEEFIDILEKKDENINNLPILVNEPQFFESMSININNSPAELLLMSLKYVLANTLSLSAILSHFKFINVICKKKILPDSTYQLDQLCNLTANIVTLHAICPVCSKYLCVFEEFNGLITCAICSTEVDVSNPSNTCYFAIIDPSNTVKEYLQVHDHYYDYIVSQRVHEKDHIKDIYDGKLYRDFVNRLNDDDRHAYVSMVFNTDGAPVFKSSTVSIWPIYIMPNEIPINERLNSTIVSGLWFGKTKPDMLVFMDAFVENMNHLSTIGIPITIKNEVRRVKIYPIVACVDTVACAPMNGTCQFNARYGCDWCLHPGQYHGGSMRYPLTIPSPEERNRESMIKHATEAVEKEMPVFGVKNDYMHCYLSGVAQQFTEYVLRYLTNVDIAHIDEFLLSMKVPHQIQRLSRPLSERSKWKSLEWENWLLFYSIPVLSTVLKNNAILQNWALLVESLFILLSTNITFSEINRANSMLHKFVLQAEKYYDLNAMTYNVHQLLHICQSVYNWGPLWAHSAFPFESANHKLLTAIHSANGVILQIIRYLNIQNFVSSLELKTYPNCSPIVSHFCQNLSSKNVRKILKLSSVTYFGKKRSVSQDLINEFQLSKETLIFSKIVMNRCLFATSQKINRRSCNYFAQLNNGTFIKLISFLINFEKKRRIHRFSTCQNKV